MCQGGGRIKNKQYYQLENVKNCGGSGVSTGRGIGKGCTCKMINRAVRVGFIDKVTIQEA